MRPIRWHLSVVAFLHCGAALAAVGSASPSPPADWRVRATEAIRSLEYEFSAQPDGTWSAPNRGQDLRSIVSLQGLRVESRQDPDSWSLRLRLVGSGRGTELEPRRPQDLWVSPERDRVEIRGGSLVEWYSNDPQGLEQGFTLGLRPEGSEGQPVVLDLLIRGDVDPVPGDRQILFRTRSGREVVRYSGLSVVDARGRGLPARLEASGDRLRILFEDAGAEYPVIVDPVVTDPDWSAESGQEAASFGLVVAGVGSVNCDAYDDIAVGAPDFDNGQADEGAVFIFYGSATGPSPTPDWLAESNQVESSFGVDVASAGDVNDDGCRDLIVGASNYNDAVFPDEGWAFVFHGPVNQGGARPIGNPTNANWSAKGNQQQAFFGRAVGSAGDFNKDLVDDVVIGASEYSNDQAFEGGVFVYYGSNPGGLGTSPETPATANWHAESNQVNSLFGHEVVAGDVTGDGASDLIVGAYNFESDFENEGRGYLFLGALGSPSQTPVWFIDGQKNQTRLGVSVAAADVNGDGRKDVVLGADDYTDGQISEGGVLVFYGVPSGLLGNAPAWVGQVDQGEAFLGISVDSAGDVNNDGYEDIIAGADGFDDGEVDEGAAFLYLGSPEGLPFEPSRIFEIDEEDAGLGFSVSGAGDVNGDNLDDVLVGSPSHTKVFPNEGGAFLFYGCLDPDRDGACEGVDNCRNLANPDQVDTDADGTGNLCDPCEDVDNDQVCDVPRVIAEGSGPGEKVKVEFGTGTRFYVNTIGLGLPGLLWTTPGWTPPPCSGNPAQFWCAGSFGIGYETSGGVGAGNLLQTTTPPSIGTISVFNRLFFEIDDVSAVETLFIGADYDDAYVAWINGVEVYRSPEFPAVTPAYNSLPTIDHESSNGTTPNYGALHNISFSGIPALVNGSNLLAIGLWNAQPNSSDLVLVPRLSINLPVAAMMRYKAQSTDPGIPPTWVEPGFDDTSWTPGNYGLGFEAASGADELINTDVPDGTISVYTRLRFDVSLNTVDNVFLGADYDDGYVVWLNGEEIHRSSGMPGAVGTVPPWDAQPPSHESSNGATPDYGTPIDITTAALGTMAEGPNLLAIGGWSNSATSGDDLVLLPRFSINEVGVDNCPTVFNPIVPPQTSQADMDSDGLGDACDPDIDGDGFVNASDNCPTQQNNQTDADLDGQGDECDICPGDPANDPDADGICAGVGFHPPKTDDQDNCPVVFNPGNPQADLDLDGVGDACDPDVDGDTFANGSDNCPLVSNDQTDTDSDLHGDACDCSDNDNQVWEEPTDARFLLFGNRDACYDFACDESLSPCTSNLNCNRDTCENFACTQSLGSCTTDQDCDQDECANFECRHGGNDCASNSECVADFCNNKQCTFTTAVSCASNAQCIGDVCTAKQCIEPPHQNCSTHQDCNNSPTDLCVGHCTVNTNQICVSSASCQGDVCRGTCTIGANVCADDTACTQDVCEGHCTLGAQSACSGPADCNEPQTDLCKGQCTIGPNDCFSTANCTAPQTDECKGTCFIGGGPCLTSTTCNATPQFLLRWKPPLSMGGLAVHYDTLRSTIEDNFMTATCVETDGLDRSTLDPDPPLLSQVFHYLIRTENDCQGGQGSMGQQSNGTPHVGATCP